MKKTNLKILPLLFICPLVATGCGGPKGPQPIEEDLITQDVRDDKYRNYYEIFVGSYYDSNDDGMGDLNGVTAKLDYIKETGFNGIWLMPIFTSPSYHKYNCSNYYEIDPKYGTMDDFENLIKECHDRDISIIIDLVLNHCSRSNPVFINFKNAFQKYVNGDTLTPEEELYKDMFSTRIGSKQGWSYLCKDNKGNTYNYECNFDSDMPEFNFDSEFARDYLQEVMEYYLDLGVDGFRLDAVKYFYMDNTDRNCEVLDYYYDLAKAINPDVYFVGECWDDGLITKYYEKTDVDSFFYFPMCGTNGGINRSLNMGGVMQEMFLSGLKECNEDAGENVPAPFLDNHDMSRMAKTDLTATKMMYGLLSMMNGSTFTYYGNEIAMTGSVKPDENVRTYFPWEPNGIGNCRNPVNTSKCEYKHGFLSEQIDNPNSMYNYAKKALFLRNQHPAIARGTILETSTCYDDWDNDTYHYTVINKSFEGENLGILINFSNVNELKLDISTLGYTEVVGQLTAFENTIFTLQGESTLFVPPYGIALLK